MEEQIIFRLDRVLNRSLQKKAKAEGITVSELLRRIAKAYLEPGELQEKVKAEKVREILVNIRASSTSALANMPEGTELVSK